MDEKNDGVSTLFSLLPEGCISKIVSLTSPKDACRVSVISVGFKSASESDIVWERFLPSDYKDIISKSVSPPLDYATKKELYFQLCHSPILINDGTLSFWLSKSSGKKCYMVCARELSIAWKDDPRYWSWTSLPESRFSEVAELLDVCWLDIRGKMQTQMLSLMTNYAVYLVFKTTDNSYGLDTVAKASVGSAGGITMNTSTSSSSTSTGDVVEPEGDFVYLKMPRYVHDLGYNSYELDTVAMGSVGCAGGITMNTSTSSSSTSTGDVEPEGDFVHLKKHKYVHDLGFGWLGPQMRSRPVRRFLPEHKIYGRFPRQRNDGWLEIFLGEFFNYDGDGDIEMRVSETKLLDWKSGLIIEGIELRPTEYAWYPKLVVNLV